MTTAPVIGNDGKGTTFGNSGVGAVRGPGQSDLDLSLVKQFPIPMWEAAHLEFRADMFNSLNHPSFSNPTLFTNSASFGDVLSENVNPRIVQFALKLNF